MSKKKAPAGAPTWMVTFADLMSLLLTFFVLLLSFSSMEVESFKKLAGAMRESFGIQSFDRLAGLIEMEGGAVGTTAKTTIAIPPPEEIMPKHIGPEDSLEDEEPVLEEPAQEVPDLQEEASRRTFNDLQTVLADEIASDVMDVIRAGNNTIVRFPDRVSFPSGSGEFKPEFIPILNKFLTVLNQTEGQIVISGHTDDIPITTDIYRSNWDLSASRATSVAHYILENTPIDPARITVQGYADSRPLVPNDNFENRAKNRRVEITIESPKPPADAAPPDAQTDAQTGAQSDPQPAVEADPAAPGL